MRWFLSVSVAVVTVACVAAPARADVKMDEPTKKATAKALQWLAAKQNQDGSWSDGGYAHNTAVTAFALLAFMSQGHLPNAGQYGPEVAKGARFLISCSRPEDGYLVGGRGGNMYCHAMATLALAELWGSTRNDEIKPVLKKAVDLIIRCQSNEGGWRYSPQPYGADISITVMQVMALRAANNAGLKVPKETMDKALDYIDRCYNKGVGGFSYQQGGGAPGFARTAAGLCILFLTEGDRKREGADVKENPNKRFTQSEMPKAIAYLKANSQSYMHYFYGHYYAAHAMHRIGGQDWDEWYTKISKQLLSMQSQSDGSWTQVSRGEVGPVYQTSIAVIVLSVPANYLPIFQR
jgi:hypothetical protein